MTVTERSSVLGEQRLTPAVTVVARKEGLVVANLAGVLPIAVNLPELLVLEGLARDATPDEIRQAVTSTGADETIIDRLIHRLNAIGLLTDEDPALAEPVGGSGAAPTAGVPQDGPLVFALPLSFRVTRGGFEALDHAGERLVLLEAVDLACLGLFHQPRTPVESYDLTVSRFGDLAPDREAFDSLVVHLLHLDLLRPVTDSGEHLRNRSASIARDRGGVEARLRAAVDEEISQLREAEREREQRTGVTRTSVIPIHENGLQLPPLGVAMCMSYAKVHKDGVLEDHYNFVPDWVAQLRRPEELTERPSVFLFSNYVWSHRANLDVSAAIKAVSPDSITIHGGPDTPKYENDVRDYFRDHPHVDITVRTEGEVTTAEVLLALADIAGGASPDLSVLRDVEGISFRLGDEAVRTPDRDRITDLNIIPSPYLTGMFDTYAKVSIGSVIMETNRGCPYGCTFCDWGSATASRVRKFDLEQVFAEIEWCAKNRVTHIGFADANFGIMSRDVEIAEKVAEMKNKYGFPKHCGTNYAKNTIKHQKKIVQTWHEAGILAWGILSLQSVDPGTLEAVRRSNIKTEKYDSLAKEFRKAGMPLYVDLMIGLPGATPASFRNDIQGCIDREVMAKIHETTLLVNSPMNDPEYREQYQIETARPGPVGKADLRVVATSSFTRQDRLEMLQLRQMYLVFENFGVLRHVARYVHQEVGLREVDFYEQIRIASQDPTTWPTIALTSRYVPSNMSPPVSWKLWIDEIHRYVVEVLGVADDSALATVLAVQHVLLPSMRRSFPTTIHLDHDYPSWHQAMLDAKDDDHIWTDVVPPLRDLPAVEFSVDDPEGICDRGMGHSIEASWMDCWELESPVVRPKTLVTFAAAADATY